MGNNSSVSSVSEEKVVDEFGTTINTAIKNLFGQKKFSDLTFVFTDVDSTKIIAHKFIVASRSPVLAKMIYGKEQKLERKDEKEDKNETENNNNNNNNNNNDDVDDEDKKEGKYPSNSKPTYVNVNNIQFKNKKNKKKIIFDISHLFLFLIN